MKNRKRPDEVLLIASMIIVMFVVLSVQASPITHEFKNPSFSGIGTSAHYLTIDEQETKRRDALAEKVQSELDEIAREIENSTLCLLYTSPSPRDGLLSRMPSSA